MVIPSSSVEMFVPRYMSPNDPEPIFRPSLYLLPTRSSMVDGRNFQVETLLFRGRQKGYPVTSRETEVRRLVQIPDLVEQLFAQSMNFATIRSLKCHKFLTVIHLQL